MFPGGSEFFDVDRMCVSDPVRLQLVIAQLVREDIDLQIQAVENSDLEDTHKIQKKSKLQARLSCWSPKGKRVSGIAVHGTDGTAAASTDAAFGLLADHWSPVFNSGGGDPSVMEKFRKYVQPFPDTVEPWLVNSLPRCSLSLVILLQVLMGLCTMHGHTAVMWGSGFCIRATRAFSLILVCLSG